MARQRQLSKQIGSFKQEPDLKAEISSIQSVSGQNSQFDMDLEQVNMNELLMHAYYRTHNPAKQFHLAKDGLPIAVELMRKLLDSVSLISFENEMMRKVPLTSIEATYELTILPIMQELEEPDDPQLDIDTGGLEEDYEPSLKKQDPWIRSKIQVQVKIQQDQSAQEYSKQYHSQSYLSSTVGVLKQQKEKEKEIQKHKRELEPAPIDLSEPLDTSFTEDEMRRDKERQFKEKMDVREAERLRMIREKKEEQLKYEMIAKDKKAKQYTYDFDGKLIPVQQIKTHKLPPSTYNINANFPEDPNKNQQEKKKKKGTQQDIKQSTQIKKKTPEEEKDFVKFMASAPPVLDTMPLNVGVNLQFDGKLREGPRPQTVDIITLAQSATNIRMPRKDYFDIVKSGNLNRSAQTQPLDQKFTVEKTRELDPYGTSLFTMEKLKRQQMLQQQQPDKQGAIKINSTKMFDTIANPIPEDEEFQQSMQKPAVKPQKQLQKSPVDEFNLQITKNQNWGKDSYVNSGLIPSKDGLIKHKPRERDLPSTIGFIPKKPRDRIIPSKLPEEELEGFAQTIEIRAMTSQGGTRRKIKI